MILASRIVAHNPLANALANAEYWWASARASIRIFGRAFYLALFLPLPRNFWRLESRAWIF